MFRSLFPRGSRAAVLTLICAGLLWSCAGIEKPEPAVPAHATWEKFVAERKSLQESVRGIDLKASINLSTPERKTRLIINFWGNTGLPLRLDLTTGFGAPVAFSREDRFGFTAYDPNAKTAYVAESGRRGAMILGLTMPFDLQGLASLAAGTFLELLPDAYVRAEPAEGGRRYVLPEGSGVSAATLDHAGRLVSLSGAGEVGPWTMALKNYDEDIPTGRSRPAKLSFQAGENVKAVIRIKEMRRMQKSWPAKALELPLPPGTRIRILED